MRKFLVRVLITTMMLSNLQMTPMRADLESTYAATVDYDFKIISPTDNQLMGAGHLDFEWSDTATDVKKYSVYVDNQLVGTTSETEYQYYTTAVKMHTLSIVAEDNGGGTRETQKVSFGVSKKGLCVNDDMGKYLEPEDMKVSWYYNWGTGPFSYRAYKNIDYVPMIWGPGANGSIPSIAEKGYKYLLSYNEPDMGYDGGGCNIDVATGVANWPNFLGYDFYLSSPAPAMSPSWGSDTWLRQFMNQIDQDTVDFIPLHCYYGTYGGVDAANSFLTSVVDATYELYGKPIWITEFAISGWGYSNEWARNSVKEFLVAVMKGLDEREYVVRYSWFSFDTTDERSGASSLWSNSTGKLTELGKAYVDNGNPVGYEPTPKPYTITETSQNTILSNASTINGVKYDDYIDMKGVSVKASSEINDSNTATKIMDSDVTSRWESVHGVDPQSIIIDLGQIRNLKQVKILWENASAKDYTVQVSYDGVKYTDVAIMEDGGSGNRRLDTITFAEMVKGRYVKINCTSRTTPYGYSIYDMAIYGTEVDSEEISIVGFQYNTQNDGFRVLSAQKAEINGQSVVESGNIYGIVRDNVKMEDVDLDHLGDKIMKFASTSQGVSDSDYSESSIRYIMTMIENGTTKEALSQKYIIRSYAILKDSSVVYSEGEEISIVQIADYLYKNKKMNSEKEHNYLYDNILTKVYSQYSKVTY